MAMAILRVKDGLDSSHLVGSLTPDAMVKSDSQGSLGGYVNNGMELDSTDVTSPQSAHEKNGVGRNENIFGKKRNKSAEDVLGTYRFVHFILCC